MPHHPLVGYIMFRIAASSSFLYNPSLLTAIIYNRCSKSSVTSLPVLSQFFLVLSVIPIIPQGGVCPGGARRRYFATPYRISHLVSQGALGGQLLHSPLRVVSMTSAQISSANSMEHHATENARFLDGICIIG
jgi:hypothetical protein